MRLKPVKLLFDSRDKINLYSISFFEIWSFVYGERLRFKAPITAAADDIHKYFFHCFSERIRLDVSSESSARQRIHLKYQALFSSKDKSKKLKCRLSQFLFGALRVNGVGGRGLFWCMRMS